MEPRRRGILTVRRADLWAVAALVGFAVTAAAVLVWGRHGPTALDADWNALMARIQTPALTQVALFLNAAGGPVVSIAVATVTALLLLVRGRFWSAAYLVGASVVNTVLVEGTKRLVARPRPEDVAISIRSYAFPSGHSANVTVMVIALALIFASHRWVRYVGALYVVLMMLSRTYLHAHWLTDVLGGFFLGAAVALFAWTFFRGFVLPEERQPSFATALQRTQ